MKKVIGYFILLLMLAGLYCGLAYAISVDEGISIAGGFLYASAIYGVSITIGASCGLAVYFILD